MTAQAPGLIVHPALRGWHRTSRAGAGLLPQLVRARSRTSPVDGSGGERAADRAGLSSTEAGPTPPRRERGGSALAPRQRLSYGPTPVR